MDITPPLPWQQFAGELLSEVHLSETRAGVPASSKYPPLTTVTRSVIFLLPLNTFFCLLSLFINSITNL